MEYKYLIFVDGDVNHNKFYEMIPSASGFMVKYGRVGSKINEYTYSESEFDKKLKDKLKKGYKDVTDLHKKSATVTWIDEADPVCQDLVSFLQSVARQVIAENYEGGENVTPEMVDAAQTILSSVNADSSKDEINAALNKLFSALPRKMQNVSDFLVSSYDNNKDGKQKILEREQNLLDTMKGQAATNAAIKKAADSDVQTTLLGAFNTKIRIATDEEKEIVKKKLGSYASNLFQVYAVENGNTNAKFDSWKGFSKKTDLLWHGSRTENWLSIAATGLSLNPNAQITGKMFGYGIYFAPSPSKSSGYTDVRGSRWANGHGGRAFMGLFEVHTGKSLKASNFSSKYYGFKEQILHNEGDYDSLWADSSKGMLRADEVIVYNESQATIRFLVELNS